MRPLSMDSEDDLLRRDAADVRDAEAVAYSMTDIDRARAQRAHTAVRRFRQGQRYFRLYNSRGPRVEVLAVEAKKGKAVVDGKRGVFSVALCDLRPDGR